uniref:Uncharacterized protein n=1 Tax=Rhizophora mucronata TaxID=61149 RepID=A0A2P2M9F0_RHIMU
MCFQLVNQRVFSERFSVLTLTCTICMFEINSLSETTFVKVGFDGFQSSCFEVISHSYFYTSNGGFCI